MRITLMLLIVVFVTLSGAIAFLEAGRSEAGPSERAAVFVVRDGEDALVAAARLADEGLGRSRYVMAYALLRTGKHDRIVAGSYRIPPEATPDAIARLLVSGETMPLDVAITFPEGFTSREMAERLTKNGFPGEAFLALVERPTPALVKRYAFLSGLPQGATLEGYLFPDTYRFFLSASAEDIVQTLLDTFEKKAWPLFSRPQAGSLTSREMLILASIVEGEVRTERDRRMVADLFSRRLAIGQPLQSDATLRYVTGETKVKYSLEETKAVSPYNTYANKGLPPGPINNPGAEAIRATVDPMPNPYFYFLNDAETGETVFSETFEEHVRNKAAHGL